MIGLGIDTGGTYTDAVIYDFERQEVLGEAKALTTREDLTIGIRGALQGLPAQQLGQAGVLALSTTLATNACVEQIGGRAKLIFIGVEKKTVEEMRERYGLPQTEDILFLPKPLYSFPAMTSAEQQEHVDRESTDDIHSRAAARNLQRQSLQEQLAEALAGYESAAIVEIFAREDGGKYEKEVRDLILTQKQIPCMLGSEMFQERNVLQRGASVLLNARLLPVIFGFQQSVREVMQELDLDIPVLIVRSDGSVMSMEYTTEHPVETILSGPAASVIAGTGLTSEENALVVDMGGTTTDVALIRGGNALLAKGGIHIGGWRTFVKGVYIDTFGLGGDSAVRFRDGKPYLDEKRVIPLCHLISRYPSLITELEETVRSEYKDTIFPMHEFLVLQKDIEGREGYTETEKKLCRALREHPLILKKAADSVGRDLYNFHTADRLEKEGVIIRAGLTPTDIMHVKGDYRQYRTDASKLGVRFMAACVGMKRDTFCEAVYDLVRKKLYGSLVRILIDYEDPVYQKYRNQPGGQKCFDEMLENCYQAARRRYQLQESMQTSDTAVSFADFGFRTDAKLIGIGAPIHVFLKDVAKLLGTEAIIPEHAPVANALGAVFGNVRVSYTVEILPEYAYEGISGYSVQIGEAYLHFEEHDAAMEAALAEAKKQAQEILRRRGGEAAELQTEIHRKEPRMGSGSMLLKEMVTVTAVGKIIEAKRPFR